MAKQRDRTELVQDWLADSLGRLSLSHWHVKVLKEPAPSDCYADIDPHAQAYRATLRLSHDFWVQTPEEQRNTLAHELSHLLLARLDQMAEKLEQSNGAVWYSAWEPQWDDATERVADTVGLLLSPLLELPEFS